MWKIKEGHTLFVFQNNHPQSIDIGNTIISCINIVWCAIANNNDVTTIAGHIGNDFFLKYPSANFLKTNSSRIGATIIVCSANLYHKSGPISDTVNKLSPTNVINKQSLTWQKKNVNKIIAMYNIICLPQRN